MCLRNAIKHPPANDAFRLSNLVDIDYLVAGGIPWRQFLGDSARIRAAPFILFSLRLARSMLATPVPISVLRELKADCTPRQLEAISLHRRCLDSLRSSSILYSKLYRIRSPWAFGGTVAQRLRWLFLLPLWIPSRPQMAVFFGLRRDSPWLTLAYIVNPIRWMIRVLQKALTR